jgi:hypothetical protein
VPDFLVEFYVSRGAGPAVARKAEQARQAALEVSHEGTPVRLLRSVFVPAEETCFYLYRAGSAADVQRAAARAGVEVAHVTEAVQHMTDH